MIWDFRSRALATAVALKGDSSPGTAEASVAHVSGIVLLLGKADVGSVGGA